MKKCNIYLNDANATKLANALSLGAGGLGLGTAILAAIPGAQGYAAIAGIFTALIVFGSSAITYANSDGNGVIIRCLLVGTDYVPFWVDSQ